MYVTRLNAHTVAALAAARAKLGSTGFPSALPRGSVSVHIRRADKVTEADLVPAASYFEAAEAALADRGEHGRAMFLTTDGAEVEAEVLALPSLANWTVMQVPTTVLKQCNFPAHRQLIS